LNLGIDLPSSLSVSTPSFNWEALKAIGRADFKTPSNSAITATANQSNGDVNTLATPRIRVRNKEKAKFLIGDRLPVISTAAVPGSGGTNGNATTNGAVYNTSVQYVEVGIKVEVEPTIYADGEVAIRLALEVSSASDPNPDAAKLGTIAYSIGTRSLNTVLRLKDGQTEVIGGLIQDEDKKSIAGIPGAIDIPILGRLFGKQTDTMNKKEVIMSITPRIVRNNHQIDSDLLEMWSGTENNMRFGARQLGSPKLQATASANSAQPAAGTVSVLTSASTAPAVPTPPTAPVATATPAPTSAAGATLAATSAAPDAPATTTAASTAPAAAPTPRAIPAPAAKGPTTLAAAPAARAPSPATAPPIGANTPGRATGIAPGVNPRPLIQAPRQPATQSAAAITPKGAPLKPLTVTAPQSAQVGETIAVTVAFPPLTAATNLETSISFDADRLRLVNVTDADSTKHADQGIRFTGEAEGTSSVRIELASGRGETLPANGGPLARLQFEVLSPTGPTQLNVDNGAFTSVENGTQPLPSVAPTELDVKPKP
jgi:general secretion pathway protein D